MSMVYRVGIEYAVILGRHNPDMTYTVPQEPIMPLHETDGHGLDDTCRCIDKQTYGGVISRDPESRDHPCAEIGAWRINERYDRNCGSDDEHVVRRPAIQGIF